MTLKDMLGRSGVVTREEALRRMLDHAPVAVPEQEMVQLSESFGRVLAEQIIASADLPEFNRSTMDGYAVRSADTFGASDALPAVLSVVGDVAMGTLPERGITQGEAMTIATGGALPAGADAVVMFEYAQRVDDRLVEVTRPVGPLENVVQTGDDLRKGDVVLEAGLRIRPQDMAALASLGITTVPVCRKPRVAIISTGDEIVPADAVPGPGRIRDSNSYALEGLITRTGGIPVRKGIVRDEYETLRTAVAEALTDCHLVVLTGGSSVGTADYTARAIEALGPPGVLIHGVSVRPGKPVIAGWAGRVPVFGLPGHPVAVAVSFDLFVRPVLLRLTGEVIPPVLEGVPAYRTVRARLSRSISSAPGREDYVRVTLERNNGELWARPIFGGSGLISTMVKAHGTVVVPVDATGIEAGEDVEVRLF